MNLTCKYKWLKILNQPKVNFFLLLLILMAEAHLLVNAHIQRQTRQGLTSPWILFSFSNSTVMNYSKIFLIHLKQALPRFCTLCCSAEMRGLVM